MERMPALFVGHGSPMNAIEKNRYSDTWQEIGLRLPKSKAILSVSAHWFTPGTRISDSEEPKMVYDMYGFPEELYHVVYAAPGAPAAARQAKELLGDGVQIDNSWGLDHGTWSVLRRLYPKADIPVFQLSVNRRASFEEHFALGGKLRALRDQGVLIFGSGNVVHNLSRVNWQMEGGYPWAETFDGYAKQAVLHRDFDALIHCKQAGESAALAFPYPDHYAPLLYVAGASHAEDKITVFNEACTLGAMSMTSYLYS